jgi:hypothetical protein
MESSNEVYSVHAELSGGVAQTRNQITVAIENFQTVLVDYYREKNKPGLPHGGANYWLGLDA